MFDTKYSWTNEKIHNYYTFRGYHNTVLFYNASISKWKLEVYGINTTFAIINSPDYPFGTMEWEIHGDKNCHTDNSTQFHRLNLNTCTENEFNCDNGSCVDIKLRCDGNIHCTDKTGSEVLLMLAFSLYTSFSIFRRG